MALSLGPQQLKQAIHSPLLVPSKPLHSFSTPRHFSTVVHDRPDDEVLAMSSPESPSKFEHENMNGKPASSPMLNDLPSWTPLKLLEDKEDSPSPGPEIDQVSASPKATNSAMKRRREPSTDARGIIENGMTAELAPELSLGVKPPKPKKARFEGVFISTKPPPHKKSGLQTNHSSTESTSLVDALARTFNANRYTESPLSCPSHTGSHRHDGALARTFNANRHTKSPLSRPSRTGSHWRDDVSTVPQTEVGTSEPEEELQLNSRLARRPLNRRLLRPGVVSESNSEDTIPQQQRDRPTKRIKPIQYESNATFIDAALRTVRAPISWDAELDFMTREDNFFIKSMQIAPPATLDDQIAVNEGDHTPKSSGKAVSPATQVGDGWRMPTCSGRPKMAVFSPYQSRGAKFRQRLDAFFGENTTVRTDKVAQPRRIEFDFFAPFDDVDREPSVRSSGSTVSASPTSTPEEGASAVPSTQITSQSPDIQPSDVSTDQRRGNQVGEADPATKTTLGTDDGQIDAWIAALQRLVKGKVRVSEEDLDALSIMLAEIESVKDTLSSVSEASELRESIKQLSELHDIPFGDRNMLRQRAENIFHNWPSVMKLVTPLAC